jgi:hypothetical protein
MEEDSRDWVIAKFKTAKSATDLLRTIWTPFGRAFSETPNRRRSGQAVIRITPSLGLVFRKDLMISTASVFAKVKSIISTSGCNDLNVFSAVNLLLASPTTFTP